MTAFVAVCAGLVALALAFALPPFLRRSRSARAADRRAANLAIYREQNRELDRDLELGTLSPELWQQDRDELARRMLEDVQPGAAHPTAPAPRSRVLACAVAALLPIAAVLLYLQLGTPRALDPAVVAAPAPHAGQSFTREQVNEMLKQLAARLASEPDNLEGWVLLGRSYAALGRYPEAVAALRRAVELKGDDPDLLVDYADVLAMAAGQSLEGEPLQVLEKALALDPDHGKALALAGTAAYERGDFAGAIRSWERLLKKVPPDSEGARAIQASIDDARARGGLAAQQPPPAAGKPVEGRVAGTVTIAPELAAKAAPDDTLFVYARAVQGPAMPLAVQKLKVRDLPARFALDDSMSMAPGMTLSRHPQVTVQARVSKSGEASPRSGDLEGSLGPVKVGGTDLKLVIDKVRP
ncbi:MAG: c-type cytochrome biogenesis protein CcmI [Burkholderiales bacterium]